MIDLEDKIRLDDHLCFSFYSTSIAINRLYKPLLDGLGITYPQFLVLSALWEQDGQSIGAIAERLALESSTITPLVKASGAGRLHVAAAKHRGRAPGACFPHRTGPRGESPDQMHEGEDAQEIRDAARSDPPP